MRILRVALAISAALHGGAVAWIQTRPDPEPERPRPLTIEGIELVPPRAVEPPPTEVMLLDDDSVAAAAAIASRASHTRPVRGSAQVSATAGHGYPHTGEVAPGETAAAEHAPPSRSKLMTMRHPTIERGPSAEFWERFAANTKPLAPKDIAGEQLASELEAAAGNLRNPKWIANASPGEVAAERAKLAEKRYEQAHRELRPDGAGTKSEHQTFRARFNPDGTVAAIDDKANLQRKGLLGGTFDVSDALMRSKGIDPYASYKLKGLDETREERAAIGKRYRTQQLARSRQYVQRHIDRLWATTLDPAARRRGLFELWDDCAEKGPEMEAPGFTPGAEDDELLVAGAAARSQVIGFIRSKLPAGSADAYTAAELARFNKRRKSRARFTPYEPHR